jgi:putative ABC transport system permease protein
VSIRRFFARGRWDDERARELDSYLAIETDENIARGMMPDAARAAALRKLGNRTLVREGIYQMNTVGFLDSAWRDLKFGARLLRLNPGFALVAILSLALGIGANTAIFQLLDAVRIRTLPVHNPQELLEIRIVKTRNGRNGNFTGRNSALTNPLWEDLRKRPLPVSSLFAWGTTTFELASGGETQPAAALWVSGDFFSTLGIGPLLGRVIVDADDQRGCGAPGAVLSYAFWQRRYGGDPSVIGRTIALNGHATEIVGVTPASFYGVEVGRVFDLAVPICAEPILEPERGALDKRHFWWLAVVARLKPGATIDQVSAQLAAMSPAIFAETVPPNYTPQVAKDYKAFRLGAVPAGTGVSVLRRQYEAPLWMLLSIAGLVLLIACGNLANLMLARASAREREIAVRLAIGASRSRLVRQLIAESALMAAIGAAIGIAIAGQLERVLLSFFESSWLFLDLRPDWRVLAFTVGIAALTCVIFGAMPALRATGVGPGAAMKAASRGLSDNRERFGLRRALVVAQVALSLVLIVGALLFVRTLRNLATLDAGFQRTGVLVADLDTRPLRIPSAREPLLRRDLLDRMRAIPGVDAAATAFIVPVSGQGWNDRVIIDGTVHKDNVDFNRVSPGFFNTLGIPMLAGRDFTDHDTLGSEAVAVVSETFVRKFMTDRDPIGRTFTIETGPGEPAPMYHIIGVARDTKYLELREDFQPLAFLALSQDDRQGPFVTKETLLIRSRAPLTSLVPAVKRAVTEVDPRILGDFQSMTSQVDKTLMRERLMAMLSGFFGGLAALLATIGLYGVMSYTVARRRNEIGIRMALGAERRDVVGMVMREAATLLAAGLAVGGALAIGAARTANALLFGLKPSDPATLAISIAGLAFVAMCASYVPALRASRLEPTEALRDE